VKNWKTTACGLVAAAAGFVVFSPDLFRHWPWVLALAKYVMVGGLAGVGIVAKDSTTHSTAMETWEATTAAEAAKGQSSKNG
jgi:hypothetical protein